MSTHKFQYLVHFIKIFDFLTDILLNLGLPTQTEQLFYQQPKFHLL